MNVTCMHTGNTQKLLPRLVSKASSCVAYKTGSIQLMRARKQTHLYQTHSAVTSNGQLLMIAKSADTIIAQLLGHTCILNLTIAYYEDADTVMESVPGDINASSVASLHDC